MARCFAGGNAMASTFQVTLLAAMGWRFVLSHARRMPSAIRSARISRFSGEPSLYLPAPILPPAPVKARNSGKIGIGNSRAIITLRMRGVVAQYGHGALAVP